MTDDPGRMRPATGVSFFRVYPPQATPLPHGEFGLAEKVRDLRRRVPVLDLPLIDEDMQHGFDVQETVADFVHDCCVIVHRTDSSCGVVESFMMRQKTGSTTSYPFLVEVQNMRLDSSVSSRFRKSPSLGKDKGCYSSLTQFPLRKWE
jgi:hypothetical protein